jgi:phosphomethylpyrimidine synthase
MRISEDVRRFAAERGLETVEALEAGMQEKAEEFLEKGGSLYVEETADS